jgi:glutathione S-transferase
MPLYPYATLVTILALLVYFWMSTQVARARSKSGIRAPVMIGDPLLERANRAHLNTLEWMPLFLVPLWLFAFYWGDVAAAAVGLVWIIGRIVYQRAYVADPSKRGTGFLIQFLAVVALMLGVLGRVIYLLATG